MKYLDQPYPIRSKDGAWLSMVTAGTLGENAKGSVNNTFVVRSTDKGRTWSAPIQCSGAYSVPLRAPTGRIYAIRPPLSFTWSDDDGSTWSEPLAFPDEVALVHGVRNGWSVSKPLVMGAGGKGTVYLSWAHIGRNGPPRDTEVFVYKSDNILSEPDPHRIRWQRFPGGASGLKGPDWNLPEHRSEEPHVVALADSSLYMVWRTDQGYIGQATSRDGGNTWSQGSYLRYRTGGRRIKHPLACPSLWKCANGKYLLWIHNNSGKTYADRNPAWICGGVESEGGIEWSEPEILLYSPDLTNGSGRLSYPGFLEEDGRYWIFETEKTTARTHLLSASLLEAAWNQRSAKRPVREGLILSLAGSKLKGREQSMPLLPKLDEGGFSIVMQVRLQNLDAGQILVDTRNGNGSGIQISTVDNEALRLELNDGRTSFGWSTDPGALQANRKHHVTAIIDGGPKVVSFVIDGTLCDGGASRQFGWTHFPPELSDVNGSSRVETAKSLRGELDSLRIYGRHLLASEAIGNYAAGF
jgi:hypothetical protein